jgi:hypothetical protein
VYANKVFCLFIILASLALCAGQRPGATFLLIPPSTRASGMAYAFTAISDDACANYYNGAGLAFLKSPSVAASYLGHLVDLWPDPHYAYFAISYPLVKSAWGLDLTFFTPGKIEKRDNQGVYLGTELVWRIAPKLCYARKVADHVSLGVAWKYVYQRNVLQDPWHMPELGFYYYATGQSWAFDFNALYKARHNMSIGAVLHNIGPAIQGHTLGGATDPLPRLLRLGVAYVPMDNKYVKFTVSCEITRILVGMFANEDNTFWQNVKYELDETWKGIGVELLGYRILSVRGGYFYDREGRREGFTFGAGMSIKDLEFDIGIDENIFDFPTQNRTVSISYRF